MTRIRSTNPDSETFQVPTALMRDRRLSFETRGQMLLVLSYSDQPALEALMAALALPAQRTIDDVLADEALPEEARQEIGKLFCILTGPEYRPLYRCLRAHYGADGEEGA